MRIKVKTLNTNRRAAPRGHWAFRGILTAVAVIPLLLAGPSFAASTDAVAGEWKDGPERTPSSGILLAMNYADHVEEGDTGIFRHEEGRPLGTGTPTGSGTEPGRDRGVGPGSDRPGLLDDDGKDGDKTDKNPATKEKRKTKAEKKEGAMMKKRERDGRDSLIDTLRVPGTPGSPTGQGARGMPGEKPIPGTK